MASSGTIEPKQLLTDAIDMYATKPLVVALPLEEADGDKNSSAEEQPEQQKEQKEPADTTPVVSLGYLRDKTQECKTTHSEKYYKKMKNGGERRR